MITKSNTLKTIGLSLVISATIISCTKEPDENPEPIINRTGYTIPTTYNFSNVNYGGQTLRITMLDSISNYMSKGNAGVLLNATDFKNMFTNSSNPFGNPALDTCGKQLKNKTFSLDQSYFEDLFDSLAIASQSAGAAGSNGVAGLDGGRLFDRNGVELAQVIKKQLMGAIFYYQAVDTYLANLAIDDNTTVIIGEGTAQEHHADEAFGYFGVPVDFPSNLSGLKYWGGYCAEVNPVTNSNTIIMNSFLKLRAAISNKDYTTRDAQIIKVREEWERIVAASAILELKEGKAAFGTDNVEMRHVLSEAVGFINSMKYNSNKKISNSEINAALDALGKNFYTITVTQIDDAINIINAVYGFDLNKF